MIDFHTHILPNIDDGSKSIEETFNLIKEAKEAGFKKIISTSHYIENYYEVDVTDRKAWIDSLNKTLKDKNENIELYLGNEIYFSDNIINLLEEGKATTINNTNYLLFEMSLNAQPFDLYNVIYELLEYKLIPVLAHPERYSFVQKNPELIYDLIQKGVLMQCNYGSIIGQYGKKAQIIVKKFYENNMVHFMGSDVHKQNTIYKKIPEILPQIAEIIGNEKLLPCNVWNDKTVPILRTRIEPIKIEEREKLLDALTEIADTDPLLRYYVDTITHEIIISFLGTVQLEVICSLLIEKYHINIRIEDPTVIYLEKPLQKADYTIHIEVPPNPFWASIGLSITPLPIGSGIQYESKVSLGYLNQSFQNAVREGINYGLEQGLYGWEVTDCKICFEYGVYYSPVSTPSDFRFLAPIVLEQTLKKAGTQLLEPYLSFILFTPQEYFSRAYNDAQKHCAIIETSQSKNDEVIFTGHIPARCINEYRNTLTLYTNGQAVF